MRDEDLPGEGNRIRPTVAGAHQNVPPKDHSGIRVFRLRRGCYDFSVSALGAGWMVPAALS
jgi:hypothetical protein